MAPQGCAQELWNDRGAALVLVGSGELNSRGQQARLPAEPSPQSSPVHYTLWRFEIFRFPEVKLEAKQMNTPGITEV